jgi:hypothetical protein
MATATFLDDTKQLPSEPESVVEKGEQDASALEAKDLELGAFQTRQSVPTSPVANDDQWVTGVKLLNIIAAISVVCLLVLLDTSIVATVNFKIRYLCARLNFSGHSSNHKRLPLPL